MKKILVLLLFLGSAAPGFSQQPLGIDVSHHQGAIDWSLVYADGKVFAFVKATEGVTYNDPQFVSYMNGGNNAGLLMGAYHFARPDNNSAVAEANHFIQVAGPYIGDGYLPPVLDLEDPPGDDLQTMYTSQELTQWVQTWLQIVEDSTGVEPIIYTNGRYTQYLSSSLNHYKLWIAEPDGNTSPPDNLGHWTDWAFKQYSWHGNVNGINGDVDLNVFNGTMSELDSLASGHTQTDPATSLDCSGAVSLECGDFYHGNESTDTSRVYSYGCNGWTETGPERVHSFTPTQNTHLNVSISGFQGDLDVYILTDCDPAHCVGDVQSSSATVRDLQAGHTYYIVVDADDGSGSAYDLYMDCFTAGQPNDISLNNASITSTGNLQAGGSVSVRVKQYYAGASTNLPSVYVGYYLSQDNQRSNDDIFLGSDPSDINANNRTATETHTLQIPSSVADGNYYLLFVADYNDQITESTDLNNIIALPVQIGNVDVDKFVLNQYLQIYPNPVENELHFQTQDGIRIQRVDILSPTGQTIRIIDHPQNEILDMSRLKPGIYLLRFTDEEGHQALLRIIKNR